jgi:thiol-disulfide isomerase/thioredoxin
MSRSAAALRVAALLAVSVLFAVLVYRLAQPDSGARLTSDVKSRRAPSAPNVRLSVIWSQAGTWPSGLRKLVARRTLWLSDLRGYPVVVNFWASWCDPCRREAAVLASAAEARRGRVVFIGVNVNDLTGDARRFLRAHDVPYVAVRSGSSVTERFGLIGLPETFYIDRGGRIRDFTRGELTASTLDREVARASRG